MRADMKKVVTERPRSNARYAYSDYRHADNHGDFDNLPSHQGMRRPYSDSKQFSDLIGPLRGYLRGCVGRPWNDVWSEICQVVKSGNTVDRHLRSHVMFEVEVNAVIRDGKAYSNGNRYGISRYEIVGLYVDPRDGLVHHNDNVLPRAAPTTVIDGIRYRHGEGGVLYPVTYRGGDSTGRYPLKLIGREKAMHIDGIWYWINMEETPPSYDAPYIKDGRVLTRRIYSPRYDFIKGEYVKEGRYHAGKRQMCSRDLRRHGLRNTV